MAFGYSDPDNTDEIIIHIHIQIQNLNNLKIHHNIFDTEVIDNDGGSIVENPFIYKKGILFVPPGTRWEYRHHPVFGKFKNIEIEHQ